jgi:predicted nucleic acid-binding protein
MLYAYWFEGHPQYANRIERIFKSMRDHGDILCSSALILSEVLAGPQRENDIDAINKIEAFFLSPAITLLPYAVPAARTFALLRAEAGVPAMDALHLATASQADIDLFLTNDKRLHKVRVPGIRFIANLETDIL